VDPPLEVREVGQVRQEEMEEEEGEGL